MVEEDDDSDSIRLVVVLIVAGRCLGSFQRRQLEEYDDDSTTNPSGTETVEVSLNLIFS